MNSTLRTKILALVGAITLLAGAFWFSMRANNTPAVRTKGQNRSGCSDNAGVKAAIDTLSLEDVAKGAEAGHTLLRYAEASAACRSEVIALLMQAMNKPNLDFIDDRPSYFLWLHGSPILGSLKAVEALDLLIDHLDVHDGMFRGSLSHQPAIEGVKLMGKLAVPKLDLALRQNSKPNLRLAAALCLYDIGGTEAIKSLEWAVKSDSNICVRRFAKIALELSKREGRSNRKTSESQWNAEVDLRRELLFAFRCSSEV